MSRLERLIWIETQILSDRYPNATNVALHFGVNRRIVYQDRLFMIKRFNAPIAFNKKRGGWYYTDSGFCIFAQSRRRDTMKVYVPAGFVPPGVTKAEIFADGKKVRTISGFDSKKIELPRDFDQLWMTYEREYGVRLVRVKKTLTLKQLLPMLVVTKTERW